MRESRVLVLDAELKTMLSVIRCLAKAGLKVIACSRGKLGGYLSKYPVKKIDLSDYPGNHYEVIHNIARTENVNCIFTHLESTKINIYNILKKEIENGKIILIPPSIDIIEKVLTKEKQLDIAKKVKIPIPNSYIINNYEDIEHLNLDKKLPLFAKTVTEVSIPPGPGYRYEFIRDINDLPKLKKFIQNNKKIIVQSYIQGHGCGIGGLFKDGEPIAVGGHIRIREAFKFGGPSTYCISHINQKALEYSLKLMREIKYSGICMIEYKVSQNGEVYFMEINPRIWGTFQLYIMSGLNFPLLAYKLFVERDSLYQKPTFIEGIKVVYLFEDIIGIKEQYSGFNMIKESLLDIGAIITGIRKEGIWDFKDPLPFIIPISLFLKRKIFRK